MKKLALIIIAVLAMTACEKKSSKSSEGDVTINNYQEKVVDLFCESMIKCEGWDYFSAILNDTDNCKEYLLKNDEMFSTAEKEAYDNKRFSFNSSNAAKCLDAMKNAGCNMANMEVPEECSKMFVGTVADGENCNVDYECISSFCDTSKSCPGKCAPFVKLGESCEKNPCEKELVCDDEVEDFVCVMPRRNIKENEECEGAGSSCAEGLYCDTTCKKYKNEGENCEDSACKSGFFCNAKNICAKYSEIEIVTTENGQCDINYINRVKICDFTKDLYCFEDNGAGVCLKRKEIGESCEDGQCKSGLDCSWNENDEMFCVESGTEGSECEGDDECKGACVNGKCEDSCK